MEHHFIIALNKCTSRKEAIDLMAKLDSEKNAIKLRANSLLKTNKESVKLNQMLHDMRKETNKLTQIRNIITVRIKEIGTQEKMANRLACNQQYNFADDFVHAAAGVLNKQTFNKIKAIAMAKNPGQSDQNSRDMNTQSKKPV